MESPPVMKKGGGSSESGGSESGADEKGCSRTRFEYFGWVYHLGTNSIGREFCHLRFLYIRGKYVMMYKRDPHENPGIKPLRRGIVGNTFMVEELGRRKVNDGDLYVLRFYNRLDEEKKGEIACATAGETRKWMEAFDQAKQQGEFELSQSSTRNRLSMENEIDLEGRRPRVRRYARDLKKLIRIGHGPETLVKRASNLGRHRTSESIGGDAEDVVEVHEWRCVRTVNGVRIFEDVSDHKLRSKTVLVKAVGVVDASPDTVFEVVLNLDRHRRYEWDSLTGDLELVDSLNGHSDVVYGSYDPGCLSRWQSKRDFIFSRQWFRGQDGTYTILQFPAIHKKRPAKSGYRRIKINPSSWEIRNLRAVSAGSNGDKCLVTQMLEIDSGGWHKWKRDQRSKFEKSVPYALLNQVSGLKAYIGANPALTCASSTTLVDTKTSDVSGSISEFEDSETAEEFYDAIADDSSSSSSSGDDDEESSDGQLDSKGQRVKLKNVSWAIARLALKAKKGATDTNNELNTNVDPVSVDPNDFHGSMHKAKGESDANCWSSPSGAGFKIRGKTYLKDSAKVAGGDPLLKLIAVDWFKLETSRSQVALHPKSLVQSEAGKKLPFILLVNLQVPAKPNYCLVLYYAADRPVNKNSLLGKFVDGSDAFRDARFKLIPSIVQGYWMVKRAVGTKACLLGKAVTCNYLRQDNFLEIDVDIGSSSVARSVIGLVLGYVTSLVVDLAILIEGREEKELPEYILGTVRLNKVRLDAAVPLDD
ncbi:protein ENHANCED DISEASE RESISTANCE 2-like isoform X2 [Rutidosis leptorrhynchoides]|uniref:protein ENHANCED DISEASE RESISTANCE 2-like isoform X2 n=1 Tax=Rutidosis leptorrhynchoides TaxID=125765 RepID=UPI003A996CAF